MATYGGGISFTSSITTADLTGGVVSQVLYTGATDKYADVSFLSINNLTGASAITVAQFIFERTDGAGGWLPVTALTENAGTVGPSAKYTGVGTAKRVSPGERIRVEANTGASTARFSISVVEFQPST